MSAQAVNVNAPLAAATADADRALPEPGDEVDFLGTLERDEFGGMPRLRLRLLDFAHAAVSPLLTRRASATSHTPPLAATA